MIKNGTGKNTSTNRRKTKTPNIIDGSIVGFGIVNSPSGLLHRPTRIDREKPYIHNTRKAFPKLVNNGKVDSFNVKTIITRTKQLTTSEMILILLLNSFCFIFVMNIVFTSSIISDNIFKLNPL